jgi:hypothetical protein
MDHKRQRHSALDADGDGDGAQASNTESVVLQRLLNDFKCSLCSDLLVDPVSGIKAASAFWFDIYTLPVAWPCVRSSSPRDAVSQQLAGLTEGLFVCSELRP